jgi:hypothetical protein
MILRAMLAGDSSPGRATHARQVEGEGPDEDAVPGPPGWGLGGRLIISPRKNYSITKTKDALINHPNHLGSVVVDNPNDPYLTVIDNMTRMGKSRKDAQKLTDKLTSPKQVLGIGNWNVRTMDTTEKAAIVAKEMDRYGLEILGLSEVRWTGFGRVRLRTHCNIFWEGREHSAVGSGNYGDEKGK